VRGGYSCGVRAAAQIGDASHDRPLKGAIGGKSRSAQKAAAAASFAVDFADSSVVHLVNSQIATEIPEQHVMLPRRRSVITYLQQNRC
jgi:hypothetical protein